MAVLSLGLEAGWIGGVWVLKWNVGLWLLGKGRGWVRSGAE